MKPQMLLPGSVRVIGFSVAASLLLATDAWAQVTFTVNTTDDGVDINPGDGNCSTVPPPAPPICTLRAAVMQANRMPNAGSIIKLPAGTYKLTIPASIADGEENGDLNVIVPAGYDPGPTYIVGDGADVTIIDAQGGSRILSVGERFASISGVSLINGYMYQSVGGAIYSDGSLLLTDVTISNNKADVWGGGIYAHSGQLYLTDSTLDGNSAGAGGAIYSEAATVKLNRTTVSRNVANYGGGLRTANSLLFVTNSTISQNHAVQGGGGIFNAGGASVYNTTIAYNQVYISEIHEDSTHGGGGILNVSVGTFDMHNSILAGNVSVVDGSYSDCVGEIKLYGVSGYEGGDRCSGGFTSPGIATHVDSSNELGILKNNGGPTETIALLPTSGLIGNGPAEECNDADAHHLTSDQRGNPRPPILQACDIGAFEYNELFRSAFDPPIP